MSGTSRDDGPWTRSRQLAPSRLRYVSRCHPCRRASVGTVQDGAAVPQSRAGAALADQPTVPTTPRQGQGSADIRTRIVRVLSPNSPLASTKERFWKRSTNIATTMRAEQPWMRMRRRRWKRRSASWKAGSDAGRRPGTISAITLRWETAHRSRLGSSVSRRGLHGGCGSGASCPYHRPPDVLLRRGWIGSHQE